MKIQMSRFGYRFLISLFILGSILYVMLYMTLKDPHSSAISTLSQHLDSEHRRASEAEQKVQELQKILADLQSNPTIHHESPKFGTLEEALMAAMAAPQSLKSGSRRNSLIDHLVGSGMTHSRFGNSAEEKILEQMLNTIGIGTVEVQVIDLTPKRPLNTPQTIIPTLEHKEEIQEATH